MSLRSFVHRKGDVVFCSIEIQALYLVILWVFALGVTVFSFFGVPGVNGATGFDWNPKFYSSGTFLGQFVFFLICNWFIIRILWIGYLFSVQNRLQFNRLQRQKIVLYTERMKHLMRQDKYKLVEEGKINELRMLLSSMDALLEHVKAKEITPKLWGLKISNLKGKAALTMMLAVVPSVVVKYLFQHY